MVEGGHHPGEAPRQRSVFGEHYRYLMPISAGWLGGPDGLLRSRGSSLKSPTATPSNVIPETISTIG